MSREDMPPVRRTGRAGQEELELEREMEYFVEPEEAFTGRDDIE